MTIYDSMWNYAKPGNKHKSHMKDLKRAAHLSNIRRTAKGFIMKRNLNRAIITKAKFMARRRPYLNLVKSGWRGRKKYVKPKKTYGKKVWKWKQKKNWAKNALWS